MSLKKELLNLLSKALEINKSYLEYKVEQHWRYATPYCEKTEHHHFKYLIDEDYTLHLLKELTDITDEVYDMGCQKQYHEGAVLSMIMVKEISLILDRIYNAKLESSKRKSFKKEYQKLLERNTRLIEELVNAAKGDRVLSEKVLDWLLNSWCKINLEEIIDQNDFTEPAHLFENMYRRSETFREVSTESNQLTANQFEPFPVANVKRIFYERSKNTEKLNTLLETHKFYFNLHIYYILELANDGFVDDALKYCNSYGSEMEVAYNEFTDLSLEDILKQNLYFTSEEAWTFIRWRYGFVYDTLISSQLFDEAIDFVLGLFVQESENSKNVRFSVSEKVDFYKKLCEDLPLDKRKYLSKVFFQNADEFYSTYDVRDIAAFEKNWPAFLQALKKDFSIVNVFMTYDEYKSELSQYPEELYQVIMTVIRNFVDRYAPNGIDKKKRIELINGFKKLRAVSKNDQFIFELVYEIKKSYPHRRVLSTDMDLYLTKEGLNPNYKNFVNKRH